MMHPTIHLNGTSRDTLIQQLKKAVNDLRIAIDSVSDAAPNGRDYYPQGDIAINQAIREHTKRMQKLIDVRKELEMIWESIVR